MRTSLKILKFSRKIHLYVGIFIAPALLFFSFTGAVQTFSLHETTQGSSYAPPRWLVVLGQLHKKQTTVVPVRRPRPAAAPVDGAPGSSIDGRRGQDSPQAKRVPDAPAPGRHLPMKIFFLLVSIGLASSTLTGIYMAWKHTRPWLLCALLLAGIVIPCLLLAF
jgi:hypothetical protein